MEHRSDQELLKSTHNTARYFVEHPHVSWIALAAVFLWGIYGYTHMPQKKDPDISVRVATASCNWPGSTAEQQEQLVTRPLEDAIAGNKTIHPPTAADYGIRSVSYPGTTVIWVQLKEGLNDTREQFSDINLRVQQASAKLPQGVGPIQFQSDFGDTAALMLTMASPQADASEVAVRSRDIQASIVQARQLSHTGNPRVTLVFAFPYKLSASVLHNGAVQIALVAIPVTPIGIINRLIASRPFSRIDAIRTGNDPRRGVFQVFTAVVGGGRIIQAYRRGKKRAPKSPIRGPHAISVGERIPEYVSGFVVPVQIQLDKITS